VYLRVDIRLAAQLSVAGPGHGRRVLIVKAIFGAIACLALSGCITGARLDWPTAPYGVGRVPGFLDSARTVRPTQAEFETAYRLRIEQARAAATDGSVDALVLSGGGATGAFGAGVLIGLTRGGNRPQYELVTGVSTGALIAPFAFLGPEWDAQLEEAYVGGKSAHLLDSGGLGSLFRVGVFEGDALRDLVSTYVTAELVEAVAAESAKGRVLMVATTNLDTEEPVFWDMGAIASRGGPEARKLFIDVLVASSSIPGVFPPVMIQVEGPEGLYDEMHVDGGVTVPFFIAPEIAFVSDTTFKGLEGTNVHVIVNGQIDSLPRATPPNTLAMVLRSSNVALMRLARTELLVAGVFARSNGMKFEFTYLPRDYPVSGPMDFKPETMRTLFDFAAACAANAEIWIDQEELAARAGSPLPPIVEGSPSCPSPVGLGLE
jgi:predicted acylesterase/phospholipase RssA